MSCIHKECYSIHKLYLFTPFTELTQTHVFMISSQAILNIHHDAPTFSVPTGAVDCHTHIFGPLAEFPLDAKRSYTPADASIEDLKRLHAALGVDKVVIVHPSIYGTDNRCTLNALQVLGPSRARGVAVIDETFTMDQLREMHAVGVRGVRVNLETFGLHDPALAIQTLEYTQKLVAPLGWHIQIFTRLDVLVSLAKFIQTMRVPLVIDHFCLVNPELGLDQTGLNVLLDLLATGRVWLKLSAAYRIASNPDAESVKALAKTLIKANPDRMLWGTDWPHPGGGTPGQSRKTDGIEPFQTINDGQAINRLATWTAGSSELAKILVTNPCQLYSV
jgi:predicted TIM-barrel fold metal-dependent hydrolase